MKRMIILMLLITSMATVVAEERSVPNSRSPNSQYEVVVSTIKRKYLEDGYEVGIRRFGDDKVITLGKTNGYVYFNAAENSLNTRALWSPDSKFVSLYLRDGRHNGDTSLYSVKENSVQEIHFADLDQLLLPYLGKKDVRGYFVRPEFWGVNHELYLSVGGTQLDENNEDFRYVVALQLIETKAGNVEAAIKSVREDRSGELFPPQIETTEALNKDYEREDAELNAVYKKVLGSLSEDGKKKLIASQRGWIALRDAQASFDVVLEKEGLQALRNQIELTQQRIATLRLSLATIKKDQ